MGTYIWLGEIRNKNKQESEEDKRKRLKMVEGNSEIDKKEREDEREEIRETECRRACVGIGTQNVRTNTTRHGGIVLAKGEARRYIGTYYI